MSSTTPALDLSRYEISIVKQAWLALNLFHDNNTRSTRLIKNDSKLLEFEQKLATSIYEKTTTANPPDRSSCFISDNDAFNYFDLFGKNEPTSVSDPEVDAIINDYQIDPLLQYITTMINYLQHNMIQQPSESLINHLKQNFQLLGMTLIKYQLFGECLIQTMVVQLRLTAESSKFQSEEQFIFNKFLSQILSFLAHYNNREARIALADDASSLISYSTSRTRKLNHIEESYPCPTVSYSLEVTTPYTELTPPTKPQTISSTTSIPSDKSSRMSLDNRQHLNYAGTNDELSFDHMSENDTNWKSTPHTLLSDTNEQDDGEEVFVDAQLELASIPSNESTSEPFDYLNSFRSYDTPIESSKYTKLKRSFSGASSRRKWSPFRRSNSSHSSINTLDQSAKQKPKHGLYRIISRK
ncbi:hypothetical protein I9W82_004750 [Candida metapsilosis]|uniref:Uncharacterized protein n=1 Tax=Candida metapsilosis TaxID=273372 RepID=A0A8H7Z8A7_9ASCO|nr:hypothetical protein I9W82_004750 [Candida metapsilosis]